MTSVRTLPWRKLPIKLTELCLDTTLRCGQSFRWRKNDEGIWSCALHGRVISLRQDAGCLHYTATFPTRKENDDAGPLTPPSSHNEAQSFSRNRQIKEDVDLSEDDTEGLVRHYLNLGPNLTGLYEQWSSADANFKKRAPKFTGVRILRQDAWEALVGFICSSNNNIIRISQMMEKLCLHYGPLIAIIDSKPYHDMPPPSALTKPGVEAHLRQLGFGYRAKYLHQTALIVAEEHDSDWLIGLRNPESPVLGCKPRDAGEMLPGGRAGYREAHEALLGLQGVGPKVADCVCLMGLGWGEAVPVDTHVWQIAQRDYKFGKGKHSSLTKATYDAVGDRFRSLWGKEAGWAHSVLFTADLRAFSERLSTRTEEVTVKKEGKDEDEDEEKVTAITETHIKAGMLTPVSVKRERDDLVPEGTLVEEITSKQIVKRSRRR